MTVIIKYFRQILFTFYLLSLLFSFNKDKIGKHFTSNNYLQAKSEKKSKKVSCNSENCY